MDQQSPRGVRVALISLALGQVLSLLITGTGLSSQWLASSFALNIPTTQTFINYLLLALYAIPLCYHKLRRQPGLLSTQYRPQLVNTSDVASEHGHNTNNEQRSDTTKDNCFRLELLSTAHRNPTDGFVNGLNDNSSTKTHNDDPEKRQWQWKTKYYWLYLPLAFADVEANYLG
jgi:hypothetical protein